MKEASETRLFGAGKKAVVNVQKEDLWHMDTSKIKFCQPDLFDESLPKIVAMALEGLGLDAQTMNVEAKLSKMSFFRTGECLQKHRSSARDPRMFVFHSRFGSVFILTLTTDYRLFCSSGPSNSCGRRLPERKVASPPQRRNEVA